MISNTEDGAVNLERRPSGRMGRSYARRHGDYLYDIEIHEAVPAGHAGRFCGTVVNVVRLAPGPPVSVTPELHGKYGATSDAACSKIEAAVTKWVKDHTRSGRDTDQP
jgi:hypothetical protein